MEVKQVQATNLKMGNTQQGQLTLTTPTQSLTTATDFSSLWHWGKATVTYAVVMGTYALANTMGNFFVEGNNAEDQSGNTSALTGDLVACLPAVFSMSGVFSYVVTITTQSHAFIKPLHDQPLLRNLLAMTLVLHEPQLATAQTTSISPAYSFSNTGSLGGIYSNPSQMILSGNGGNTVLITDQNGLQIVDFSTPSTPALLNSLTVGVSAVDDIKAQGDSVYILSDSSLVIIALSNPPSIVNTISIPHNSVICCDIAVNNNNDLVYMIVNDSLIAINVIDPYNPAPTVNNLGFITDYIFPPLLVSGNYAYIETGDRYSGGHISVYDISNLNQATLLGNTGNLRGSFSNLAFSNNFLYIHSLDTTIKIVDVSDPSNPFLSDTFTTLGDSRSLTILGNILYKTGSDGRFLLETFDISETNNAVSTGSFVYAQGTPGSRFFTRDPVAAFDSLVLIAHEGEFLVITRELYQESESQADSPTIGIVLGTTAFLAACASFFFLCHRNRRKKRNEVQVDDPGLASESSRNEQISSESSSVDSESSAVDSESSAVDSESSSVDSESSSQLNDASRSMKNSTSSNDLTWQPEPSAPPQTEPYFIDISQQPKPSAPPLTIMPAENLPMRKNPIANLSIDHDKLHYKKELGSGSAGRVYKGSWEHSAVAIKQLYDQNLGADLIDSFQQEINIMAQLSHVNIVQLYGACYEPGHYAIVMEYLPNGTLYDLIGTYKVSQPWPTHWNINIATDIAAGLGYLHNKDIIHRDLKSPNVLLDTNNRAKLTDFGLAKIKTATMTQTMSSGSVGTIPWMAPELFTPNATSTKFADIYGYGIILWELVSKSRPYQSAPNPYVIPAWVQQGQRETIPNNTPVSLAKLISKCWDARAQKRPSATTIVKTLQNHMKTK